jgi:hypothetical protein
MFVLGSDELKAIIALRAINTPKPNTKAARIANGQRNQIHWNRTSTKRKNPAIKHKRALKEWPNTPTSGAVGVVTGTYAVEYILT